MALSLNACSGCLTSVASVVPTLRPINCSSSSTSSATQCNFASLNRYYSSSVEHLSSLSRNVLPLQRKVNRETATGGSDSERIRLKLEVEADAYDNVAAVQRVRGKNLAENEYVKVYLDPEMLRG